MGCSNCVICRKTIDHPHRCLSCMSTAEKRVAKREIVEEALADTEREMNVNEIAQVLDLRSSNISQHLRVLRSRNIVESRKEGQIVYYKLTNSRLPKVCAEIRSILLDGMKKSGEKFNTT